MPEQVVLNGSAVGTPAPVASISTGGFFWRPTDIKVMELAAGIDAAKFAPAAKVAAAPPSIQISAPQIVGTQVPRFTTVPNEPPLLTKEDGNVLSLLQKRNFQGKGFNTIFRPRSNKPLKGDEVPGSNDNVLQLNLTQESLTFSESLGKIPNRGFGGQEDIELKGISYVQRVDDLTNPKTGQGDGPPSGIHFEPGVWLAVPKCDVSPPKQAPTLCRMASIPHGTTINAQGVQPAVGNPTPGAKLADSIKRVDITPFFLPNQGRPAGTPQPFPSQTFSTSNEDRIPGDLTKFASKSAPSRCLCMPLDANVNPDSQVRISQLLADPNAFLRNSLQDQAAKGQEVIEFVKFDITTQPTPTLGGGTANIAFLGGSKSSPLLGGQDQNAHAVQMTATFWVETVKGKISIAGNKAKPQSLQPAGPLGPTFVVGPTTGLSDTQIPVTWTQLQYSQNVLLNFAPLSWPHVSVATLTETTTFDVQLQAQA